MIYPLGGAKGNCTRFEDTKSHLVNSGGKVVKCDWCGTDRKFLKIMKNNRTGEHPAICDNCFNSWEKAKGEA